MQRGQKKAKFFCSILVLAYFALIFYTANAKGTPIPEVKCGSLISVSGEWELLRKLDKCGGETGTFGLKINASNVVLDCRGREILAVNDSVENYGIFVEDGAENVTILNCEIFGFKNAIFVNGGAKVKIAESNAESRGECAMGNWEDGGNNIGCLDIRGPEIRVTNQTVLFGKSFVYRITASDISGVIGYFIRGESESFNMSDAGVISNISALKAKNYSLIVGAKDRRNQTNEERFYVFVIGGNSSLNSTINETTGQNQTIDQGQNSTNSTLNNTLPNNSTTNSTTTNQTTNQTTNNTSNTNTQQNDDSSSSSSNTAVSTCASADIAWDCGVWGTCANGTRTRQCIPKGAGCVYSRPAIKENCTIEIPKCEEKWECNWSECLNGTKQALDCRELNSCNTTTNKPLNETCEAIVNSTENQTAQGRSFLTGAVIGVWDGIKSFVGRKSPQSESQAARPQDVVNWIKEKSRNKIAMILGIAFVLVFAFGAVYFKVRKKPKGEYVPELDRNYFYKMSKG